MNGHKHNERDAALHAFRAWRTAEAAPGRHRAPRRRPLKGAAVGLLLVAVGGASGWLALDNARGNTSSQEAELAGSTPARQRVGLSAARGGLTVTFAAPDACKPAAAELQRRVSGHWTTESRLTLSAPQAFLARGEPGTYRLLVPATIRTAGRCHRAVSAPAVVVAVVEPASPSARPR